MSLRTSSASVGSKTPRFPLMFMSADAIDSKAGFGGISVRSPVSPWVRFSWQTASVPEIQPGSSHDIIRPATKDESQKVIDVILQSLSMDSSWNASLVKKVEQYLADAVTRLLARDEPLCLVIPKGNRLIAASLLDPSAGAESQLISGPAVLVEYQNRGIGARLLHASLAFLGDRGFATVSGVTRANSVAAKYVYPKFGGLGESLQLPSLIEICPEAKA